MMMFFLFKVFKTKMDGCHLKAPPVSIIGVFHSNVFLKLFSHNYNTFLKIKSSRYAATFALANNH